MSVRPRSQRGAAAGARDRFARLGGLTLIELLVSALIFGITVLGFAMIFRNEEDLSSVADRRRRAFLLAQDLYEEMRAVPYACADLSAAHDMTAPRAEASRVESLGSIVSYDGLVDSPATDILGSPMPWGSDLSRRVTVRSFAPRSSSRMTGALRPYLLCTIEIQDRISDEILHSTSFIRAAHEE
ncbi:MAG: hypothetical protein AAB229_01205 [Candidatus Hydrogenedentota bacterium]